MLRVGYIAGSPSHTGKHSLPQRMGDWHGRMHGQGFTLVEVMIAMAIGPILLAAPFHKRALAILEKVGPASHAAKPVGPAGQTQAKTLETSL